MDEHVFVCAVDEDRPDDYPMRTVAEVLASAPRGFPRPVHPSGLPTPWIANQDDLSDANAFRRAVCVVDRLCQVCGLPLGGEAVVCWRPGDILVIDGAAMHPARCWPMARAQCPELVRLAAAGTLRWSNVLTATLVQIKADSTTRHDGMPVGYHVPNQPRRLGPGSWWSPEFDRDFPRDSFIIDSRVVRINVRFDGYRLDPR